MRIKNHSIFPSLKQTDLVFCEGEYLELQPENPSPVTLVPPGQFGPPDKVSSLEEVTNKPGLMVKNFGKGRLAFIPWHIGELYHKFSNDKHRHFVSDLIDHLVGERQLTTNAHPTVELSLMSQENKERTLVHLINMSGHHANTFFDAVEMKDISIRVRGEFKRAVLLDGKERIGTRISKGYTQFTLPLLKEYSTVLLFKK
jgi:hypothetical protein